VHSAALRLHDVRPSVCPSVCDVRASWIRIQDHNFWKSWKLSTRKISPTPSLFEGHKPSTYSHGNMRKLGETRGGVGKSGVLEHKNGNISETRKDTGKLLWRAYRKSQTFFRTVPSPTTYTAFPSPRLGVRNPTPKLQSLL